MAEIEHPATERPPRRWPLYLGWALVAIALIDFGYEMVLAATTGGWRIVPAGELWFKIDVGSLNLMQAVIQRYIWPTLWDPIIVTVLQWPPWSIFGAPGAVLVALFWKRRPADAVQA
jgi:hypothetical protein